MFDSNWRNIQSRRRIRELLGVSGLSVSHAIVGTENDNLIAYWPLNDTAGPIANDEIGSESSQDVIINGDFETAGVGTIFDSWEERASDGALDDEGTIVHGGSHAIKTTAGAGKDTWVYNAAIQVRPGVQVTITIWARGDGSNSGRYAVYDNQNTGYITSLTSVGVTAASYTEKTFNFTPPAGCYTVRLYLACPNVDGGIAYFDDVSVTYSQPLDGVYADSGVTYSVNGYEGDCVQVDGSNTHIQIGCDAFSAVWNGNKGSAIVFGRVDAAARWTDSAMYRYLWHSKAANDATVYLAFGKHTDNHTLFWRRRVANVIFEKTKVFSPSGPTEWFAQGMCWDIVSDVVGCYISINGSSFEEVYRGTFGGVGNEEWVNATYPVNDNDTQLLAGSGTSQEWIGRGQHAAYWADVALTADQFEKIMTAR